MGLVATDMKVTYGAFIAVDGVSLAVEPGQILGIAGPNGAGKTTLFDAVSGHHRAAGGRVELNGKDISGHSAHRRAREGLARTFQSPIVPTELTVGETLEASRIAFRPKIDREHVQRARTMARLDAPDGKRSGSLDTLERRKLLLACVLLRQPSVLMLDEPCSGLMQDEIDEIDAIIREVTRETGMAVIVVEHRLELLRAVAETVLVMDAGKRIAEGPPAEVFDDPLVRAAYFEAPVKAA